MKRWLLVIAVAGTAFMQACAGCESSKKKKTQADDTFCPSQNEPVIVRTEFDPKEGKAPLAVVFTVKGEDDDFEFCEDEELRYHFDFDGDGYEDGKPRKSGDKVDHVFSKPGDYRVSIWVSDAADQESAKTTKYIKVGENKPPVITTFTISPPRGQIPLDVTFKWGAIDPDGTIDKIEIDFGDGSAATYERTATVKLPPQITHKYTQLGTHVVTFRVYDDIGASAETAASVSVFAQTLPSNFLQTIGTSRALALNDNGGAHFGDAAGLFDYGLVADGYVGLKVVRYPLAAFSVTTPAPEPARLLGMADVTGTQGFARDVVSYENLAVVAGSNGLQVYNFFSPGPPCNNFWDSGCYPGTPTAPVAYCNNGNPTFFGADFAAVDLIRPSNMFGAVWAVALDQPGSVDLGGIYALRVDTAAGAGGVWHDAVASDTSFTYNAATGRLDAAVFISIEPGFVKVGDIIRTAGGATATIQRFDYDTPAGRYYAVIAPNSSGFNVSQSFAVYPGRRLLTDCWQNNNLTTTFSGYANAFNSRSYAIKVTGDYAYIGVSNEGLLAVDLGGGLGGSCSNAACFQSSLIKWRLAAQAGWTGMQHAVFGLTLTDPRPVSANVTQASFLARSDLDPNVMGAKFADCSETQTVSYAGAVTKTATHALLRTKNRLYPGNFVAIATTTGTLTNNGAGYLVTGNSGESTVIAGDFSSADPATWTTVSIYGALSFARLPGYPGKNPVAFSGYQADKVARNGTCLSFMNAYAPITSPVGVSYDTAPMIIAVVDGVYDGLVAFDRSDPAAPVQLTRFGQMPYLGGIQPTLVAHDNWLFIGNGSGKAIDVLDISDPYHLGEAYLRIEHSGTFARTPPGTTAWAFGVNDLVYRVTPQNPKGVLLVASGEMGLAASYMAPFLEAGQGVLTAQCRAQFGDASPCMNYVPDLQLRHEGTINDIKLVDNQYALVAQRRGGVLVFDVSNVVSGGDPRFVSHIRTKDDPLMMRVVDDAGTNTLFIADRSSLYKIPLTDPTKPGVNVGALVTGRVTAVQGYNCVDASVGNTFACATVYRDYTNGNESSYAVPSVPAYQPVGKLYFAPDVAVPTYEVLTSYGSLGNVSTCVFDTADQLYDTGATRLWSDVIANRLFLFMESSYGLKMSELIVDGSGNIALTSDNGRQVGRQCLWWVWNPETLAAYQNRPGVWRRFYGADPYGSLTVYDMGVLETKLLDPSFDPRTTRDVAKIGSINLAAFNTPTGYAVKVQRILAAGPYIFIGAGDTGAWILDVSDGYAPKIIGRSAVVDPSMVVSAINVIPYADALGGTYTYLALTSDNRSTGGIRLLRFPGLAAP